MLTPSLMCEISMGSGKTSFKKKREDSQWLSGWWGCAILGVISHGLGPGVTPVTSGLHNSETSLWRRWGVQGIFSTLTTKLIFIVPLVVSMNYDAYVLKSPMVLLVTINKNIILRSGRCRWCFLDRVWRCPHFLWLHRYLQGRSYCNQSCAQYIHRNNNII